MSNRISTTQQKVDPKSFGEGMDRIFGERCPKHVSEPRDCPTCKGWTRWDWVTPPEGNVSKKINGRWYWTTIESYEELTAKAGSIE